MLVQCELLWASCRGATWSFLASWPRSVTSVFSKWSKCGTDLKDPGVLLLSFNKKYYRARRFWCNSNARMRTVLLVFWLQRTGRRRDSCAGCASLVFRQISPWIQTEFSIQSCKALQVQIVYICLSRWFRAASEPCKPIQNVTTMSGKVEPVIKRDAIWCDHDFWILLDSFGGCKPLSGSSWQIQHNFPWCMSGWKANDDDS